MAVPMTTNHVIYGRKEGRKKNINERARKRKTSFRIQFRNVERNDGTERDEHPDVGVAGETSRSSLGQDLREGRRSKVSARRTLDEIFAEVDQGLCSTKNFR